MCGLTLVGDAANLVSADTFDPGANGIVSAVAVQPDGSILLGGNFSTLGDGGTGSIARPSIGRIRPDGTVDDFNTGSDGHVFALALQPDGKVLVGGDFSQFGSGGGGLPRARIGRAGPNGQWDLTFNPGANGNVNAIVVQPDGKILVGGSFTMLGGGSTGTTVRNGLGRLNADGTLDTTFDPGTNGTVNSIVLQPDGNILVAGSFSTLGGGGAGTTVRNNIGRLDATGAVDITFNPGADSEVAAVVLQADGKILVGGGFTAFDAGAGATTRSHIARLNADGTLDSTFDPGADSFVASLAVQTDGKIVVSGEFTMLGGGGSGTSTRLRIGRVNSDGSLDPDFDPGANGPVIALALQADGKLVAGGYFTTLGGGGSGTTARSFIGRITNTDPAVQSVTVSPNGTVVTWLRSGSGPEVVSTTFETSTDGTTYTLLGSGTRVTGGWQLAGQSLPINQNIYIRARGYYGSGLYSTSGSITELVQVVFVGSQPTVATSPASDISFSSATLNGAVNPNGLDTVGRFEYGLTGGYGATTADQPLGAGVTPVGFSGAVAGLSCNTVYHYRVTATNSTGTAVGLDGTFTTLPCPVPPAVTTGPATGVFARGATLNGMATPNSAPTTGSFEYGVTTDYGSSTTPVSVGAGTEAQPFTGSVVGLACNTSYHFRAVATNAGGTVYGDDGTFTTSSGPCRATPGDFDGDAKTELTVWRPTDATWYWLTSSSAYDYASAHAKQWGTGFGNVKTQNGRPAIDTPMLGDIDGDGVADLVVWTPSTGTWSWLTSGSGYDVASAGSKQWGNQEQGDVPMLGDIDGDGRADLIVWRASTGTWYWLTSSTGYNYAAAGSKQWGNQEEGDVPKLGDIDGDGKADLVVWRAPIGTWIWVTSSTGYDSEAYGAVQWGNQGEGDVPLLGDLDGDGRADLTVWRASTGTWFWLTSGSSYDYGASQAKQWGNSGEGDIPLIGKIDDDGLADLIVWRASSGTWYWLTSGSGYDYAAAGGKQWGSSSEGDIPLVQ